MLTRESITYTVNCIASLYSSLSLDWSLHRTHAFQLGDSSFHNASTLIPFSTLHPILEQRSLDIRKISLTNDDCAVDCNSTKHPVQETGANRLSSGPVYPRFLDLSPK